MVLQQFEVIKQVTFSGKFPLVLSDADISEARCLHLDVFVTRQPTSPYFSSKTNPPESFYGTFIEMDRSIALRRYDIDYSRQRYRFTGDADHQVIPAMKCIYDLQRSLFGFILEELIPGFVISEPEYLDNLTNIGQFSQLFLFKCYADTALTVVVYKKKWESCYEGSSPTFPPPPPPEPPTLPSFSPGVPITEGYAADEGINAGDYEPFPGDGADGGGDELFPFGDDCVPYRISITFEEVIAPGVSETATVAVDVWGIILDVQNIGDSSSPSGSITIFCSGRITDPCTPGFEVVAGFSISPASAFVVNSIVPL